MFRLTQLVRVWRHEWLIAHGGNPPALGPLRRPWEEEPEPEMDRPRMSTKDEVRAFFGARGGDTKIVVSRG